MRAAERFVAIIVLSAFAAEPVLAAQCAANCEIARPAGAPACHHDATSTARLAAPSATCGRDHQIVIVEAASEKPLTRDASFVAAAIVSSPPEVRGSSQGTARRARAPSSPPLVLTLDVALRI